MKRRNFIAILSFGIIGTGIGILAVKAFKDVVKDILETDTSNLNVKATDIDKYLLDADKDNLWKRYDGLKEQFVRGHSYFQNPLFKLPYHTKYSQYRSEIVGHFLLSTDFFYNKMDEKAPINYLGLYNPYFKPCANPFSNAYYRS